MDIMKKYRFSSFEFHLFLILLAIEVLMSFTFFGYIHFPPVSITFAYIPILIAACVLGTKESAVLGAVFGLASMYKSTVHSAQPVDMLFSPVLSGKPVSSLVMALGVRILFGFLAGIAFCAAKKCKKSDFCIGVVSFFSPIVHAMLILAAMCILFPECIEKSFFSLYIIVSNTVSAVICVLIIKIVRVIFNKPKFKNIKSAVDRAGNIPYANFDKKHFKIAYFSAFIFCMTVAAAWYFSNQTYNMLRFHNVAVSGAIKNDLTNMMMQFTAAGLSLNALGVVILNLFYRYTNYQSFIGECDAVTGVMGRRIFLNCCGRAQKNADLREFSTGWFLFIDVDNFKTVNDNLGHAAGDSVLKEIALTIKSVFYDYGICGRMGGDEFAVMLDKAALSEDSIKKFLDDFLEKIADILPENIKVTCSIGACRFSFPADITSLMDKADELLYKAKQNGRACYVLGEYDNRGE